MMTLASYLKIHGLTQAEFAERIGVRQSTISKLCSGAISVRMQTAAIIERATNGQVPMSSWVQSRETGAVAPTTAPVPTPDTVPPNTSEADCRADQSGPSVPEYVGER